MTISYVCVIVLGSYSSTITLSCHFFPWPHFFCKTIPLLLWYGTLFIVNIWSRFYIWEKMCIYLNPPLRTPFHFSPVPLGSSSSFHMAFLPLLHFLHSGLMFIFQIWEKKHTVFAFGVWLPLLSMMVSNFRRFPLSMTSFQNCLWLNETTAVMMCLNYQLDGI